MAIETDSQYISRCQLHESILKDIQSSIHVMNVEIIKLRIEVASLKIKSGLWGGIIGGVLTFGGTLLVHFLTKR